MSERKFDKHISLPRGDFRHFSAPRLHESINSFHLALVASELKVKERQMSLNSIFEFIKKRQDFRREKT
jgi:hypothetical protein